NCQPVSTAANDLAEPDCAAERTIRNASFRVRALQQIHRPGLLVCTRLVDAADYPISGAHKISSDVVTLFFSVLKLPEAPRQLPRQWWISRSEEGPRFGRKDQIKHPSAP